MLEIKYIKAGEKRKSRDAEILRLKAEATSQLAHYGGDEKFGRTIRNITLVKLVLIFSGPELLYIGPAS
jgi:hypothetical protein